jgi:tRNA G18 (ribose-2'-O)-methylase SpoU
VAFIPVADPADARLADYRNVPDPELIARGGLFVAEGRLVVARLLASPRFATRSVLVSETARRALDGALDARRDVPVYVVAQWMINAITGFNIHRGCLALGERPPAAAWSDLAAEARRLVVVERVANADNIGAIFRNAAAFGADAVLLEGTCTDPLYRKAIRTSMGAALQVPFARAEPWPGALGDLAAAGWSLVALTPSGTRTLDDVASGFSRKDVAAAGPKIAIVLGHEGEGLTREALDACDVHARIPIAAGVDSLNVATAGALAMYLFSGVGSHFSRTPLTKPDGTVLEK